MSEQRQSGRRRTYFTGLITKAKFSGWSVDCAVKNVSAGGVMIAMPRPTIPDAFEIAVSSNAPLPAKVVWCREGHVGLSFTSETVEPAPRDGDGDMQTPIALGDGPTIERSRLAERIAAVVARQATRCRRTVPRLGSTGDRRAAPR